MLAALLLGVLALTSTDDGEDGAEKVIAAQDDRTWFAEFLTGPQPGTDKSFEDISCPGPALCVAIGNDRDAKLRPKGGFAMLWSGDRWRTIGSFGQQLRGIDCPTTTSCMVVGNEPAKSWHLKLRGTSAAGPTWQGDSPPRPRDSTELSLRDVSCTSPTSCTVAGIYYGRGFRNYVSRWDGSRWVRLPAATPENAGVTYGMLGVSCPSPTFCVTVGKFMFKPFIEHWDGTDWRIASVPHPPGLSEAHLEGISCTSPTACMAVGRAREDSGASTPFAERWDGSEWSIVDTPPLARDGYGELRDVSCLSASSCVAVGGIAYPHSEPKAGKTVAMTWNGTEWALQDSPPSPKAFPLLNGVSCAGAACMAAGSARPIFEAGLGAALAERLE